MIIKPAFKEHKNTFLTKLMNSSVAWAILSLLSVLSILLSVYTIFPQTEKQFSYLNDTRVVISSDESMLNGIDITYSSNKITELRSTTIRIWNSGNKAIMSSDIASLRPLTISFDSCGHIYRVSIIDKKSEVNRFTCKWVTGEHKAIIDFEYINPNDYVVLQVLHSLPIFTSIDTIIIGEKNENVVQSDLQKKGISWGYYAMFLYFFFILYEVYKILFNKIEVRHAIIIIVINAIMFTFGFVMAILSVSNSLLRNM